MNQNPKNLRSSEATNLPKESVTLTSVFVFLGLIFVLIAGALIYLRFSSWSIFASFYHKEILTPGISINDISARVKTTQTTGKSVDVKITDLELKNLINLSSDQFPLKKSDAHIKPEGIFVTGKTSTSFLGVSVEVLIIPRIENQKVAFEIKEIKAGGIAAPPKIVDMIKPKFESLFSQIANNQDFKATSVRTQVGFMVIECEK
jgi:hypothetical protein